MGSLDAPADARLLELAISSCMPFRRVAVLVVAIGRCSPSPFKPTCTERFTSNFVPRGFRRHSPTSPRRHRRPRTSRLISYATDKVRKYYQAVQTTEITLTIRTFSCPSTNARHPRRPTSYPIVTHPLTSVTISISPIMGNKLSSPSSSTLAKSKNPRSTPPSIDIVSAASPATLALRPSTSNSTNPKNRPSETESFTQAFRRRRASRTAYTLFSCGRNLFIPYAGMVMLQRGIISALPGTAEFEDAADQVWIRIVMSEPQQRQFWEAAASEAKAAMDNLSFHNLQLLEARGLPLRRAEYEAWAVMAVEELVQQVLEKYVLERDGSVGTTEEPGSSLAERDQSEWLAADRMSTENTADAGEATDSSTAMVPLYPNIILTPPATPLASQRHDTPVTHSPCAFTPESMPQRQRHHETSPFSGKRNYTPAAYAPSPLTPASLPRKQRDSTHSIAESLCHEPEEAFTPIMTERLTPVKARIVELR